MSDRPRSTQARLFAAITLCVLLVVGGVAGLAYWVLGAPSFTRNQAWYAGVAAEVASGKVVPDATGVVRLDQSSIPASGRVLGEAYVHGTPTPTGGMWMLFIPHWRGKGSNVEGYLYSPASLGPSAPAIWPHFTGGGFAPTAGELAIERSLGNGWYLAAYRTD